MSNLPKGLEKAENEEEVGANHGDVTGAWRIVRNGLLIGVIALAAIYALYV